MQLIRSDIAVNLTDPMYRGEYHGKSRHASDLENVVKRAREAGVERILITGTSLSESRAALDLAKQYSQYFCQARS
jgi:TatD DNase family protein